MSLNPSPCPRSGQKRSVVIGVSYEIQSEVVSLCLGIADSKYRNRKTGNCQDCAFLDLFNFLFYNPRAFKTSALVAHLDRASGFGPEGRGFESLRVHQKGITVEGGNSFLVIINLHLEVLDAP